MVQAKEGEEGSMRPLGQSLGSIIQRLKSSPRWTNLVSEPTVELCPGCAGRGVSVVPAKDGTYSVEACKVCRPRSNRDYFADLKITPGNKQAVDLAKSFASKPEGWIVLVGEYGTGKSWLLNAIVSTWGDEKRYALSAVELLDTWRGAFDIGDFLPVFTGWCESSAIVLDDLGAEKPTEWAQERLYVFLNYRYSRALPTAIATNYDRAGLEARLGGRIADRVFDQGTGLVRVAHLNVPSFRQRER